MISLPLQREDFIMSEDPKKLFEAANRNDSVNTAVLHVRIQGRSREIALDLLDISTASSDDVVKNSVARFMELSPDLFKHTVVERHDNGNMTLRPEAVFG